MTLQYKEGRVDFNYGRYRSALADGVTFLKRVAEYIKEVAPENSVRADAMLVKIDRTIAQFEALPANPTRQDFKQIEQDLKNVKQLIKDLNGMLRKARQTHSMERQDDIRTRVGDVLTRVEARSGVERVATCRALLTSDDTRGAAECLRGLRQTA
jgi:ElaB/YqjD/DUF883 family membrane-anchored ribosome-binding protein